MQEADLRDGENHGDRHDAHQLESGPEIGAKIAPDEFVQESEEQEEASPTKREETPATVLQLKDFAE